jgi:hypothetical protein
MALSVVVRWRPVRAFVNGTLVARPAARTTEPFEVPAPCRSILRRWKLGDLAHIS